jgi:hypothetical protein
MTSGDGAADAEAFLDSAGVARAVTAYAPGERIYSQGEPCDTVLYVRADAGWRPMLIQNTLRAHAMRPAPAASPSPSPAPR